MTRVLLWGPSEHATENDEARLVARLAALGCSVERRDRGAAPDSAAAIVVVNTKRSIGREQLAAMPSLRFVITTTSGFDHVDLDACATSGVAAIRCPLARRDAVVETTLAMGLALLRRLPELTRDARDGRWVRAEVKTRSLPSIRGLVVGIVGHGVIGSRAAEAWRALGATVLATDPAIAGLAPLEDVLARSALLTLHCSRTPSSERLLSAPAIATLKPGAIVLNTARGECVDLPALLSALDRGALGGIGLDVFAQEPPPELSAIAARANVIVTPHSAGYFDGLARAVEDEVVATIAAIRAGTPPPGALLPAAGQDRK